MYLDLPHLISRSNSDKDDNMTQNVTEIFIFIMGVNSYLYLGIHIDKPVICVEKLAGKYISLNAYQVMCPN